MQLQSDGGGKYTSHQFQSFLSLHRIQHCISYPYTAQQNGLAEHKHRHIMDMGLTLLARSHLPTSFWNDAFLTSIFIINRLPTPTLDNATPFLKLFGSSHDYTFFRTFGCSCFPPLHPYTSHKLMFRSKLCIFIVYSSLHKGYKCLDPLTHTVYISRHVVFDKKLFPANEGAFSPATLSPSMSAIPLTPINFSHLFNPSAVLLLIAQNASTTLLPLTTAPPPTPCSPSSLALPPPSPTPTSVLNLPNSSIIPFVPTDPTLSSATDTTSPSPSPSPFPNVRHTPSNPILSP
jgi:hypothetical protein